MIIKTVSLSARHPIGQRIITLRRSYMLSEQDRIILRKVIIMSNIRVISTYICCRHVI